MAHDIAKSYKDKLPSIQKSIEDAHKFWTENRENFNKFRKAIYKTSLTKSDRQTLKDMGKPDLEFNVLEAYLSRLKGEWSKQTPSFEISSTEINPRQDLTLAVLEAYLQAILQEANLNGFSDKVYDDTLSGGYSIMKVRMDYAHGESFDQIPYLEKVLDPTLAGFDPLARNPTKSDGNFCYELCPMLRSDFERDFPDANLKNKKFIARANTFNWTYMVGGQEVVLVAYYYEKEKTKQRLLLLADGQKVTSKDYSELKKKYEDTAAVVPAEVTSRWITKTKIVRYTLIEGELLDREETDFYSLPLVFADGNSAYLSESADSTKTCQSKQFTRPYFYHAMDMQRLKNFAGQTLAAELENLVQSKFLAAEQTISPQNMDAWIHPQKMSTLIWNHIDNNGNPLPKPEPVPRVGSPPEVFSTFDSADKTIQSVLGSYDAALGINQNQLSGVAIVEGATQSNATAMPYVINYLLALTQVGKVILEVLPFHLKTPRTLPLVNAKGERFYIDTGDDELQDQLNFELEPNALNVTVKAGPNFEIQKNRALEMMIRLMQTSESIKQMMESDGLPILLDNLDIRGQNELKSMAVRFMEQRKQAAQAAQQQAQNQPNPLMESIQIEKQKVANEAQKMEYTKQYDEQKLANQQFELALKESKQKMEALQQMFNKILKIASLENERDSDASKIAIQHMRDSKSLLKDILNPNP